MFRPGVAMVLAALALAGCASKPAPRPANVAKAPAKPATKAPPRPTWQARKVVPDAVDTPQGRIHTVKPGETGIAIAIAYGVKWDRIVALNALKPPYVLEVGDRLRLPTKTQVAAQTPEERARAFSLDIDDIITGGEPAVAGVLVPMPRPATTTKPPPRPRPTAPPPQIADAPPLRWPVEGRVLSGFGAKPGGRFNDGVNLKATAGAPVRAAGDGVVAYAGDAIPGFGNLVLIKHDGGWVTAYGHAEAVLVTRGAKVSAGDVIARAGATGAVTEPQVHFEVRRGRTPVDPERVVGR
jgi:murein DD-endopeptidase MepM/ murein hydrolase activator NlpD